MHHPQDMSGSIYIADSTGQTTGVFIPINDWNDLKNKYEVIEQGDNIPNWQKDLVRSRIEEYDNNPDLALYFDSVMDEIEKEP